MVIDPWCEVIADAGDDECVVVAEVDLNRVTDFLRVFPALQDSILKYGT